VRGEDRAEILALTRGFLSGETSAARFAASAQSVCARALGAHGSDEAERAALDALYDVASRHRARLADPSTHVFATDGEVETVARRTLDVLGASSPEPAAPPAAPGAAPVPGVRPGGRITIDPAAVVRNFRTLARLSRGACGAVVKADAYGLGIGTMAPALARGGCGTFFVALPQEGLALRALLPDAVVYVLGGTFGDPRPLLEARLRPFLSSLEALAEWPLEAPFALNVDTGMNRLGIHVAEAAEAARFLAGRGARPALVASHFACADVPGRPENAAQERAFARALAAFPDIPASFANSAALLTRPSAHFALTRPGIALYGGTAVAASPPLEPAVRLEARVIEVRQARAGEAVGYGAAERLARPSRLAVAAVGYADGYLRAAGGSGAAGGAPAFVNGVLTRLVGRVSMDVVTVDVTDAPCRRGDWVELFGPNVPLEQVARKAGTIGYELLTGLSRRAERRVGPL